MATRTRTQRDPKREDLRRLGERIREQRRTKGMTQENLAQSLDLSVAYVSLIERGGRNPPYTTVLAIARPGVVRASRRESRIVTAEGLRQSRERGRRPRRSARAPPEREAAAGAAADRLPRGGRAAAVARRRPAALQPATRSSSAASRAASAAREPAPPRGLRTGVAPGFFRRSTSGACHGHGPGQRSGRGAAGRRQLALVEQTLRRVLSPAGMENARGRSGVAPAAEPAAFRAGLRSPEIRSLLGWRTHGAYREVPSAPADLRQPQPADGQDRGGRLRHGLHARDLPPRAAGDARLPT